MTDRQRPRLGEREGLRIEATRGAVATRLSPDHVRIEDVQVRGLTRTVRGVEHEGTVRLAHDEHGAPRVEWRQKGSSTWRPASLQMLARDNDAESDLWQWLRRFGVRRPSPSGPSGATPREDERETKQCLLRLTADEIAQLDARAARAGVTRSELVRRWIRERG